MDFSRERYDRFLTLAADQHCQMVRAWGSGMPEIDDFYDLCDRKGLMVLQEWPTAWNSHETQPYDVLEETVRRNTLRLRSHPSLVMWGGGNESPHPFGRAIDMMGRLSIELDGTRPFHRGEQWGGSMHGYPCYWGRESLDATLKWDEDFYGEFGTACMPVFESVRRYMPDDEMGLWPPPPDGSFAYHVPVFNREDGVSRLTQNARYFARKDCGIERFTVASQVHQVVALRHTLERARTRWPACTGALYYKMNDNFPAASWATADWYGAPKMGHYFCQDAFAPLHACVIFSSMYMMGTPLDQPVFLLDDADALKGAEWQVRVRAYDGQLGRIAEEVFAGSGSIKSPQEVGHFRLAFEQTETAPLFVVSEVLLNGRPADRTFYWLNYEFDKGCLFRLPQTRLNMRVNGNEVVVKNEGELPAAAVNVARPGHLDSFRASDNFFWLDAGEEHAIAVNEPDGLTVEAWNAPAGENPGTKG